MRVIVIMEHVDQIVARAGDAYATAGYADAVYTDALASSVRLSPLPWSTAMSMPNDC